ncbi:hypothetical protein ECDEC12A_4174 [Escherichia coli DEC12A]|nr:hypothetical protein ECDEC12A_4174 [Escherichia coli DEC12A]EHX27594.1 hypothetical protein ECDEC12C_4290 [Escherichia coli DEC12C]EHX44190.1 hypothetical protein ECDEC12E_4093 [Escherichia coli DEC12E]
MQIQSVKYRFTTLTFFDYFLKKAKYYCPDAIINPLLILDNQHG